MFGLQRPNQVRDNRRDIQVLVPGSGNNNNNRNRSGVNDSNNIYANNHQWTNNTHNRNNNVQNKVEDFPPGNRTRQQNNFWDNPFSSVSSYGTSFFGAPARQTIALVPATTTPVRTSNVLVDLLALAAVIGVLFLIALAI